MNRRSVSATLAIASLLLLPGARAATFPDTFEPRLMSAEEGWFYTGATPEGPIGGSYTGIGDVDADGYDDLFVGTGHWARAPGHYLLYGGPDRRTLVLGPASVDPADGLYIGERVYARAIGDFNGDGIDDWLYQPIVDPYAGPTASPDTDVDARIVFGQRERYAAPFRLGRAPSIRLLDTAPPRDENTSRVHPVDDFDGDGLADVLVLEAIGHGDASVGVTLVTGRGGELPTSLDPRAEPDRHKGTIRFPNYRYWHDPKPDATPWRVDADLWIRAGADINGDGRGDVLVLDSWNGPPGGAYVLFGSELGLPPRIDNETLDGTNGISIFDRYPFEPDDAGLTLSWLDMVSDTDGDRIDDLLITAVSTGDHEGQVEVILGRADWPARLDADALAPLSAYSLGDTEFSPVGDAGDVNGDGLGDWFVGRDYAVDGTSIVYGREGPFEDRAADALDGVHGFTLIPAEAFPRPWKDMRAGDVDGDGVDDLLVGSVHEPAPFTDLGASSEQSFPTEPSTGFLALILGRLEQNGPASPAGLLPVYGPDLIELRWRARAEASTSGFELTRDDVLIASLDPAARRYEDTSAPRDTLLDYAIVTVDAAGQRSAPARIRAENDHEHYPTLAGEVYSDTLAELFWVDEGNDPYFGNREYDIYRDGALAGRREALSWLDERYTPAGHRYFIATEPERFRADYRLRSETLELPRGAGTRAPASVGNPRAELSSIDSLGLSWEAAAWGVEPLRYEVFRNGVRLGETAATGITDTVPEVSFELAYSYRIVTVDANGRRSSPMPYFVRLREPLRALLPREPLDLRGIDVTETSVSLRWNLGDTGTMPAAYEIWRDGEAIARTDTNGYADTGLEADSAHRYEVRSLDADGNRSLRTRETLRVLTEGGPFLPERVQVLAYGPSTVEVIWPRAVSGATYVRAYEVYRDGVPIAEVDALSLMDEGLAPGVTYTYAVRSVGVDGAVSAGRVTATVTTPLQ